MVGIGRRQEGRPTVFAMRRAGMMMIVSMIVVMIGNGFVRMPRCECPGADSISAHKCCGCTTSDKATSIDNSADHICGRLQLLEPFARAFIIVSPIKTPSLTRLVCLL